MGVFTKKKVAPSSIWSLFNNNRLAIIICIIVFTVCYYVLSKWSPFSLYRRKDKLKRNTKSVGRKRSGKNRWADEIRQASGDDIDDDNTEEDIFPLKKHTRHSIENTSKPRRSREEDTEYGLLPRCPRRSLRRRKEGNISD